MEAPKEAELEQQPWEPEPEGERSAALRRLARLDEVAIVPALLSRDDHLETVAGSGSSTIEGGSALGLLAEVFIMQRT